MNHSIINTRRSWLKDLLLLCLLIGSAFAFLLGDRPLNVPDEARYSEIPREMLVTHDFTTPRLNGIKYFEKPALFYWLQAGALKVFGLSEWSCRFVDALLALFGCLGTYAGARLLFNRRTALFSTTILASSLLYFSLARVITLDMTVSVFIALTLLSFISAVQFPLGITRRLLFYACYIFSALALLTKGLIGLLFPGAIILIWLLFTFCWVELKNAYLPTGILLFVLIALPWHLLVQQANPEFFYFYFIDQHFLRYLTMEAGRYQPMWYYLPILLLGLFPWTGFLWPALQRLKREDHSAIFFFIWAVFIFLFFSISKSKLVPYILPCFPPLAILIGNYFASLPNHVKTKSLAFGISITSLICLALACIIPLYLIPEITTNYHAANEAAKVVIAALILNSIAVPLLYLQRGFFSAFMTQLVCSVIFLFSLCATVPYIYMDSIKPLAQTLKPLLKPSDRVVTYDYYYQDLPFYLQSDVTIANWQGELAFGLQHQPPTHSWISDTALWQQWQTKQVIYLVISHELLKNLKQRMPYHFYPVALGKNDDIVTNHER